MGRVIEKRDTTWRDAGPVIVVPLAVFQSAAYIGLSAIAVKLLWDLAAQLRQDKGGVRNNGDLCAPWSVMKAKGWKSKETLQRAMDELLASGLIQKTRQGMKPRKASLYAVTWQALDRCNGKLDITVAGFHRSAYLRHNPPPAIAVRPQKASP